MHLLTGLYQGQVLGVQAQAQVAGESQKAVAAKVKNLRLKLDPGVLVDELRDLLVQDGRGKGRIVVALSTKDRDVEVALPGT